jgi:L-seryl-tRNA(Ser) seleniumtransferase
MTDENIYRSLGVSTVINAAGTKTRISGSLMRETAADSMREASNHFVRISDLQAHASKLISEITTAEAGYVSSGASAGLTLCAAACIAEKNLSKMNKLPDTADMPSDIVMPKSHRNGYDHAFRVAGASIVDVGGNDHSIGTGGNNTERWELDSGIDDETVAVAYMQKSQTDPPLEEVVEVAHAHSVPVIVDAAAELPPTENLSRFVEMGADLVVFSGGKAIRGPQTTGIIAGKQEYIESIALQQLDMHTDMAVWDPPSELFDLDSIPGVPRQGIGRGFKVGKEELVGIITALNEFIETDHQQEELRWESLAERMATELRDLPEVEIEIETGGERNRAATVFVRLHDHNEADAAAIAKSLRQEDPRIFVGTDYLDAGSISLNPMCLSDDEATYVVERLKSRLGA